MYFLFYFALYIYKRCLELGGGRVDVRHITLSAAGFLGPKILDFTSVSIATGINLLQNTSGRLH